MRHTVEGKLAVVQDYFSGTGGQTVLVDPTLMGRVSSRCAFRALDPSQW